MIFQVDTCIIYSFPIPKGPLAAALAYRRRHNSQKTGHLQAANEQLHNLPVSKLPIRNVLIHIYLQIVMIIAQRWHQLQLQQFGKHFRLMMAGTTPQKL